MHYLWINNGMLLIAVYTLSSQNSARPAVNRAGFFRVPGMAQNL